MAKESKTKSRYSLHNAKQKLFSYVSSNPFSSPSDVEVERGSFRIKARSGKIFKDGMRDDKGANNRQNGNKNHKPLKVPY